MHLLTHATQVPFPFGNHINPNGCLFTVWVDNFLTVPKSSKFCFALIIFYKVLEEKFLLCAGSAKPGCQRIDPRGILWGNRLTKKLYPPCPPPAREENLPRGGAAQAPKAGREPRPGG